MKLSDEERYFKKMLDASTNVIWNEMKKIRESSEKQKKLIRRRWIWELIQNASDCTPQEQEIDINVTYSGKQIIFSHNGLPFSFENLEDLITQLSSKQSSEEEKAGKFGTGFMSTHLLSEIVQIKGSFNVEGEKYSNLDFLIDRTGREYGEVKENTRKMLENLKILKETYIYDELFYKYEETKFIYDISEGSDVQEAIEKGLKDLKETIPYVFAFNKNINSITLNGKLYEKDITIPASKNEKMKVIKIKDGEDGSNILVIEDGTVSIACSIDYDESNIYFLPFSESMPKIFCRFPLIGTEEYCFPIIVNSSRFEVEQDRDAIRDGNSDNLVLMKAATVLYKELLNYCSCNSITKNEYNISILDKPNASEIQEYCYKELKLEIEKSELIQIPSIDGSINKFSYKNDQNQQQIGLLSTKNVTNLDSFWDLINEINTLNIPTKDTYIGWAGVFNSNLTFGIINEHVIKGAITLSNLNIKVNCDVREWLNNFYKLWIEDEGIEVVIKNAYVPNQKEEFISFSSAFLDQELDIELKNILVLLGNPILDVLIDREIVAFNEYFEGNIEKIKTDAIISKDIDEKISQILSKETIDRVERDEGTQLIFNKLTNWFIKYQDRGKELFKNLFSKRMMLSTPEENLLRYEIAEKVQENNLGLDDLEHLISSRTKILEIMSNEDLNSEAMIEQLKHVVKSSKELREYVNGLINRSIKNIYKYLSTNSYYTLPETLEEWEASKFSETVFPVKYKDDEIHIIIRPSDYQKIIFYHDQELEALDDTKYQLWTDNGEFQKMITLGDLLKTTGISAIPLRKL
ncbi:MULTISPECIES: sacsin N-terminal ATP-binding-like domain-containing protein [Lysinibacillus]|uniref:ATP-binding protein n=1 Tax=Lysinibacillus xylanilyticus TaxID=582475 RepID=A0ABV3W505_9BACI